MVLNILKYTVFIIFALILPIFLYTSFAAWLVIKMFDHKKKIPKRRYTSFTIGVTVVVVSLSFQYFMISKRAVLMRDYGDLGSE